MSIIKQLAIMCVIGVLCLLGLIWAAPIRAQSTVGVECEIAIRKDMDITSHLAISQASDRDVILQHTRPYWNIDHIDGTYVTKYQCSKRSGVLYYSWRTYWPELTTKWSYWYPAGHVEPEDALLTLPE